MYKYIECLIYPIIPLNAASKPRDASPSSAIAPRLERVTDNARSAEQCIDGGTRFVDERWEHRPRRASQGSFNPMIGFMEVAGDRRVHSVSEVRVSGLPLFGEEERFTQQIS